MTFSSSCPMTKIGSNTSFWIGLVAGAMLWAHVGLLTKSSSNGDDKKAKQKSVVVRAPGIKAWRMSKWIKHNGIIRTQGLCGDFSKIPGSSMTVQTQEALAKLDQILTDAGVQRRNLIAITIYVADLAEFEEMNAVYDKWVDPAGLPTRLCVQAKIGHQAKVEIRAEAYYDEED